jgi:hypothetical protein
MTEAIIKERLLLRQHFRKVANAAIHGFISCRFRNDAICLIRIRTRRVAAARNRDLAFSLERSP